MSSYRLYTLDDTGHIMRAPVEFDSVSDEEAIKMSQRHRDGADNDA